MADDLGEHLDGVVDDLVATGRYASRAEVLSEGVLLVQKRAAAIARFEAEIQLGLDDIDAGRVHPAEDVFSELLDELRAKLPDRSAA